MIHFAFNQSSSSDVKSHLERVSPLFRPELTSYVNLEKYSDKIYKKANRIEIWDGEMLIGLIAYYLNTEESFAFITNVSLEKEYGGSGLATQMMWQMIEKVEGIVNDIKLEVRADNVGAIRFYTKLGFEIVGGDDPIKMELKRVMEFSK